MTIILLYNVYSNNSTSIECHCLVCSLVGNSISLTGHFLLQSHDSWQGHDSDQVSARYLENACENIICINTHLLRSLPWKLAFLTRSTPFITCTFGPLLSERHADSVKSFRNLHVDVLVRHVHSFTGTQQVVRNFLGSSRISWMQIARSYTHITSTKSFPIRHDFRKPFCDTLAINVSIVTKVFDVEIRNSYSSVCFDIGLAMKSFSVHYVQLKVRIKRMQYFLFDFETRFSRFVLELTCERLLQLHWILKRWRMRILLLYPAYTYIGRRDFPFRDSFVYRAIKTNK